ncbi:hypothetical protein MSG28_000051 [Choristoneura fumiferana]|uniref:Uncharacterized protein n=1 Tax=Choristoneura fumiferana TaxID=7141 RepID=A0ACC0JZ52_CHOFU|nr:hypothetical protein MSG28_000051 [Choristoneura fumiferana]
MVVAIRADPAQALYPKWLIEVERKRAEAELCRARAEEARTQVAARAARAATAQAAALRSLARAATAQAEAVARIAAILERAPQLSNSQALTDREPDTT